VIGCIGETLEQRESGKMFDVLDSQLRCAGLVAAHGLQGLDMAGLGVRLWSGRVETCCLLVFTVHVHSRRLAAQTGQLGSTAGWLHTRCNWLGWHAAHVECAVLHHDRKASACGCGRAAVPRRCHWPCVCAALAASTAPSEPHPHPGPHTLNGRNSQPHTCTQPAGRHNPRPC
jgi:hypothetical protein